MNPKHTQIIFGPLNWEDTLPSMNDKAVGKSDTKLGYNSWR